MPVLVRRSISIALKVVVSLAVFPLDAGSDELDEVGHFGAKGRDGARSSARFVSPSPKRKQKLPQAATSAPTGSPTPPPPHGQKRPSSFQSRTNAKTQPQSRPRIPPRKKSRSGYSRSVRKMIRAHNKKGQPVGDIKLYAKENRWGPPVKIQSCYGDNILTRFSVTAKGSLGKIWFQFKDVTYRQRRRGHRRHQGYRWIMVEPGMLIVGRYILLRAQTAKGNDVVSLKVLGNCIEDPVKR